MRIRDQAMARFAMAKTGDGAYTYLFPSGANFRIAKGEDGKDWELACLNEIAHELIGRPERSLRFRLKRYAYAHMFAVAHVPTTEAR